MNISTIQSYIDSQNASSKSERNKLNIILTLVTILHLTVAIGSHFVPVSVGSTMGWFVAIIFSPPIIAMWYMNNFSKESREDKILSMTNAGGCTEVETKDVVFVIEPGKKGK